MSKYDKLRHYLSDLNEEEWHPAFSTLEQILGWELPRSARLHAAWWANDPSQSRHARSWLDAGWETGNINLSAERITFRRIKGLKRFQQRSTRAKATKSKTSNSTACHDWDMPSMLEVTIHLEWSLIGRVVIESGRLCFPEAPKTPAIYRFRVRSSLGESSYFGETDNLARRFGNYRNPGPRQETNLRINKVFKDALSGGAEISVAAVVANAWIIQDGLRIDANLSSKSVRRLFENAAVQANGAEIESLNR